MKNGCVVLKNSMNNLVDDGVNAVVDELFLCGYAFDEIRFLPAGDAMEIKKCLTELVSVCENVFFLVNKRVLEPAKQCIPDVFLDVSPRVEFGGSAIYHKEKTSLFLLSADETDTGVGYVKNGCIPFLCKKYGVHFEKTVVRSIGAGITHVERLVDEIRKRGAEKIACNHIRKYDEDIVEIVYDDNTPKMLVDDLLRRLVEGLEDTVYALNNNSIEKQLVELLKIRGKKLSVAESFTGGGLAKRIVSVSGASAVYFEGVNTYDELSKIKRLGVSSYTLGVNGAVSEKTAYEMALGLLNTGDCDISIATTGLAGPQTDRSMLPVGLCFIAVGTKERICVYRYKFDGTRQEITEKAINYALFLAYKQLKDI